jgi:hypothetical protein
MVASGVVRCNEFFEAGHDVVLVFGLGSEDRDVSRAIIDGNEGLGVATDGSGGELLEVKEHTFADVGRWW